VRLGQPLHGRLTLADRRQRDSGAHLDLGALEGHINWAQQLECPREVINRLRRVAFQKGCLPEGVGERTHRLGIAGLCGNPGERIGACPDVCRASLLGEEGR
jgi:hypothetical protein